MRNTRTAFLLSACAGIGLAATVPPPPPTAKTEPVSDTLHGVTITDPYRWLEDQDSPATRAWLAEQEKYTKSYLATVPGRAAIEKRLNELLRVDQIDTPRERGGRYFTLRRRADQNQSVIYVRKGLQGQDETLVDGNTLSPDQSKSLQIADISQDGKLLAYGVRQGGEDEVTLQFLDVDNKKLLTDTLPRARYMGVALKADRSGVYYSRFAKEGARVYYHAMGSDPAKDTMVFGEKYGPMQLTSVHVSDDGRYAYVQVSHGVPAKKIELFVRDLRQNGAFQPIVTGLDAQFHPEFVGDAMYVRTNWDAPNQKVLKIDLKAPAQDKWQVVVPEGKSAIDEMTVAGGKLVINYLENASTSIKLFDLSGKPVGEIKQAVLGTADRLEGHADRNELFYKFESFTLPPVVYRYDLASGQQTEFARVKLPFDGSKYDVKQVWYESKDKTRVPMFLASKKGLAQNGENATFLTGYGGFNLSRTPRWSPFAAYWIEQGGVFALPNLRGGGEFGEKWHEAGMFEHKQNVFDDFIGAGEYLVREKYTKPAKLAIAGGSNGGLLVGAAMTQRPDLFGAVICAVPLLDMVRYQKFKVGHWWTAEYGSAEVKEQFPYIYKYSPYHHVEKGVQYPSVMFVSGDSDTRVDPLHARKMAALMQSLHGKRAVLLHYDTKGGHSAGKPVTKQVEDLADELLYLKAELGM